MRSNNEQQGPIESSSYRELQVLSQVEDDPEVTQRELSQRIGIALGLTNLLLRNLAHKGYVKVTNADWKRRIYSLTPKGLTYRVRLTVSYVQRFLNHYQAVRQTLREQLEPLSLNEESRVAIYGTGEFAELVYLGLKDFGIEEIDIFAEDTEAGQRFLGMPVRNTGALRPEEYDRVVVALLGAPMDAYLGLRECGASPEKLVTFFDVGDEREEG